jgi:hypothetical protein
MARFSKGIFNKRAMRLIGFAYIEQGLRHGLDLQRRQEMIDFPQFARVTACDDKFLHIQYFTPVTLRGSTL